MANEVDPAEVAEHAEFVPKDYDIMDIFEELTFRQKFRKVMDGLKAPKDSGDYKYAKLQILRLSGPAAAVVAPVLFMGLLILFAAITPPPPPPVEIKIMEPEPIEELDEIEELEREEIEPPDPMEIQEFNPDVTIDNPTPSPVTDFSPVPAEFDSVAMVKSPVIMKGIYGSRNPGARGQAMKNYGGSGATEGAVLRALRWLKKYQAADGSWNNNSGMEAEKPYGTGAAAAHTAIALLTFLAHGETPAAEEFGPTVEKAIRYLVDGQKPDGTFNGSDGHNYSQPIVAYALSEAFALTRVPVLKETAQKAIKIVIDGQHPSGGWDYNCKQSDRDDTSYMGWCAQSIKAAKMAGLENEGLEKVFHKAVDGFKKNYKDGPDGSGGFGYTSGQANGGLTGVGVLCMQLLGASKESEVRKGLMTLQQTSRVSWDEKEMKGNIYYWYYNTQAFFHAGGELWNNWNKEFAIPMVKGQVVIPQAIADPSGKMQDIGYWPPAGGEAKHLSRAFDTCLCALQLQVYYRYLPTFKPPEEEKKEVIKAEDDIDIDIKI